MSQPQNLNPNPGAVPRLLPDLFTGKEGLDRTIESARTYRGKERTFPGEHGWARSSVGSREARSLAAAPLRTPEERRVV